MTQRKQSRILHIPLIRTSPVSLSAFRPPSFPCRREPRGAVRQITLWAILLSLLGALPVSSQYAGVESFIRDFLLTPYPGSDTECPLLALQDAAQDISTNHQVGSTPYIVLATDEAPSDPLRSKEQTRQALLASGAATYLSLWPDTQSLFSFYEGLNVIGDKFDPPNGDYVNPAWPFTLLRQAILGGN